MIEGIRGLVEHALAGAKLSATPERITGKVYVTGINARSRALHALLNELFPWGCVTVATNPDRTASLGAAVLGCIINGELRDRLLLEVLPRTIGVETDDGGFTAVVTRDSTLAVSRKRFFRASKSPVALRLFEGEDPNACQNDLIAAMAIEVVSPSEGSGEFGMEVDIEVGVGSRDVRVSVVALPDGRPVVRRLPHIEPFEGELGVLFAESNEECDALRATDSGEED